jgi:single-strand DNA-binding protein
VAWRSVADFAAKNLSKGRVIVVKGQLQNRDWVDKNGVKRTTAEVLADNLYFSDNRKDGQAPGTSNDGYEYSQLPVYDETAPDPIDDDELPF